MSPGRKPSFSPASTAGRARMMRETCLLDERRDCRGHGEVRLPGAGGPDAEHHVVGLDLLEVPPLVQAPRNDHLTATPQSRAKQVVPEPRRLVLEEELGGQAHVARPDSIAFLR